ncbi:hypothetical protein B6U96_11855 [Archaeoglobales archaeon ex4484_92]|nr:MAG: hypothetical protein B6U96_11855 [Archaeoglobales archaeon ex4484_92]
MAGFTTIAASVVGPLFLQAAALTWLYTTITNIGGSYWSFSAIKSSNARFYWIYMATLAPLLPLIAGIGTLIGMILVLQDIMVKSWEHSWLKAGFKLAGRKAPVPQPVPRVLEIRYTSSAKALASSLNQSAEL